MERKAPPSYAAIHAAVFDRIVQGQYRPTHRIAIAALAEALGVSTTPVREALRQLAGRDLVVERHREGFYLAPLNARAIASLYHAHGRWMEHALRLLDGRSQINRQYRNLWRLFDATATHSGDFALIAVRRYLDDRLIVLRRYEAQAIGDVAERGSLFAQALGAQDFSTALTISASFHDRCVAQADLLATAFERQA